MNGVVLRCSNCGTVQTTTGECEACHEAQVQYFCTNHAPGLWLDMSTCPQCGARFGEAPPAPPGLRRAANRPSRPPSLPEADPAAELDDRSSARDTKPLRPLDGSVPDGIRRPTAGLLLEALVYAARARSIRKAASDDAPVAPVRATGGGCVRRLLLLALLLAALFLLVPVLLGGALLRML